MPFCQLNVSFEVFLELGQWHRPAEQVTLEGSTPMPSQEVELGPGFDAFNKLCHAQRVLHGDAGLTECRAIRILVDVLHKGAAFLLVILRTCLWPFRASPFGVMFQTESHCAQRPWRGTLPRLPI